MLGSILSNLLLVLGMSFFAGTLVRTAVLALAALLTFRGKVACTSKKASSSKLLHKRKAADAMVWEQILTCSLALQFQLCMFPTSMKSPRKWSTDNYTLKLMTLSCISTFY